MAATLLREAVAAEDRWIGDADPSQRDAQVQRFVDNLANTNVADWVAEQLADRSRHDGNLPGHHRTPDPDPDLTDRRRCHD